MNRSFGRKLLTLELSFPGVIAILAMLVAMNDSIAQTAVEIAPGLVGVVHEPDQKPVGLVVGISTLW